MFCSTFILSLSLTLMNRLFSQKRDIPVVELTPFWIVEQNPVEHPNVSHFNWQKIYNSFLLPTDCPNKWEIYIWSVHVTYFFFISQMCRYFDLVLLLRAEATDGKLGDLPQAEVPDGPATVSKHFYWSLPQQSG